MITVAYIRVGRTKVSWVVEIPKSEIKKKAEKEIMTYADSLDELIAYEAKRALISKDITATRTIENPKRYIISAGVQSVGYAEII